MARKSSGGQEQMARNNSRDGSEEDFKVLRMLKEAFRGPKKGF
jgi:hypothetical protein